MEEKELNLLGLIALVVGLFATLPTSLVALAYVYRLLSTETEAALPGPAVQVPLREA